MAAAVPLSLYVHLPWCVRKCPYCDFNSHAVRGPVPETEYVDALLADLGQEREWAAGRRVQSIFVGGGTPSLFSADALARLMDGITAHVSLAPDCEITLEANPGATDAARFAGYRRAGVNRLSIGVQSLSDDALRAIGRIHDARAAREAVGHARDAGFDNLNLDLMFALPGQSPDDAVADVEGALALGPEHISHYQLTLEPGTAFWHRPPWLPGHDRAWAMQRECGRAFRRAGFRQYETSAWSLPGRRCRHNLNYWRFGDYLGIGAGAHGKITTAEGRILRYAKVPQPGYYRELAGGPRRVAELRSVDGAERGFEFMLNALRLHQGVPTRVLRERTGLEPGELTGAMGEARRRGLLSADTGRIRPTALGRRFLDDLTAIFLPE